MKSKHILSAVVALAGTSAVFAGVSADEAAKLKGSLTPFGAEKSGNPDGSIPAWTGGMTTAAEPAIKDGQRTDPFKGEKPSVSITAKNMDQYAAKLTDGSKAMLKRYPDSFRIDVYPTHRTAAAPQWVYNNTFKNATNGKLDKNAPTQVYGGIPFPIPGSGAEVMWNHLLRWRGTSVHTRTHGVQVTTDGKQILTVDARLDYQLPYYMQDGNAESMKGGDYLLIRLANQGPPLRAGEAIVGHENLDADKTQAWVYLTGQRRVRKLPVACCDTPTPATAGMMSFDEIGVWTGKLDRFDWKIVGKQEMYIPYNSNRSLVPRKDSDVVGPKHLNPDHVRWELHRVWVLEAALATGQRHQVSKARYYVDEDSWMAVLGDRWDAKGQLWKTTWGLPYVSPDVPAVAMGANGFYDLLGGGYYANDLVNETNEPYLPVPTIKDAALTPEALAGEGVR